MTIDTSEPHPAAPPASFARGADPVEAAIARHQGTRQDLAHAAAAMNAADLASRQVEAEADAAFSAASEADGAAWADLLATRPDGLPGAVRLLRYVSASPASEVVEDPQDLLRQLTAIVEAAEAGRPAGNEPPANLQEVGAASDPAFAAVAEYRAAWDAAVVATRVAGGNIPDAESEAMMAAYDRLREVRPTTAAGFRALAEAWAWRLGQDGEPGDGLADHIAESLIAGAGVHLPAATDELVSAAFGPDPVFATIEAHRTAFAEWDRLSDARDALVPNAPGYAEAAAATDGPFEREVATFEALFAARPTTLPGAKAQAEYLVEAIRRTRTDAEPADSERGLRTVAAALGQLVEPGTGDGAEPMDWYDAPAGFMASPAIQPFSFVRISDGVFIELGRLRGIAVAEFERRREAGTTGERLERLRRELHLDTLLKAARGEGSFDVPLPGVRDWQAWAAEHPGMVPFPAHAPTALVALDLAIRGEAERLLALAEAEVERCRQDHAGYADPEVWHRVEQSLRREMRMEALAAVASDLPEDDGAPDPALSAIAASRRAEAEMAAFGENATGHMTPEMRARENALSEAQEATRAAAWATVPTTRAGRLALVEYTRFQVELFRASDGEVDNPERHLPLVLDALGAAIRAERPGEAMAVGSPAEHPDAALLARGPTITALIAAQDTVPGSEEEACAKIDGLVMAETRRLAGMRAQTLDGLILKARFVERGADEELKDAIVTDLLAMGGEK